MRLFVGIATVLSAVLLASGARLEARASHAADPYADCLHVLEGARDNAWRPTVVHEGLYPEPSARLDTMVALVVDSTYVGVITGRRARGDSALASPLVRMGEIESLVVIKRKRLEREAGLPWWGAICIEHRKSARG